MRTVCHAAMTPAHYAFALRIAVPAAALGLLACGGAAPPPGVLNADTVFAEDFESGTLAAWHDGVDPTRHRVVRDPSFALSGSHYLEVTYPADRDGGWLTRWFMPGYDSLYVSYYVRLAANWQGSTKLIAFYGSRTDNQWSAMGQAGKCPTGTDFFATMLVTDQTGTPGATRFYSYYPAMAREPDGVTCWGRYGDGTETYVPPLALSLGAWHRVEFWVKLNTPGAADASQTFWLDGVQRGTWSGLSFRTSTILRLNSVQLTFSSPGVPQIQKLYVDDIVVSTRKPGTVAPAPAPVASVTVSPASASLAVGATQLFTATLKDASGNTLTGRSITWASSNPAVATVSSPLVTAVAAGSATITAMSEGKSGTAVVSVSSGSTAGSNEPAGLTLINEQPWDCVPCNGWNYRADHGWSDIRSDPAAPKSPANALRVVFPTSMPRDQGPSNQWLWLGTPQRELYVGYWIKWGEPWDAQEQGAKVTFTWTQGGTYIYTLLGPGTAPYEIGKVVGWSPYGYSYGDRGIWHPNVTTTQVWPGQWYFVEEYFKYPSTPGGSDGVMRWWVNGTLNGNYTNVTYPADGGFVQFEFPFTRQATPQATSYVYVDHTRVSGRP